MAVGAGQDHRCSGGAHGPRHGRSRCRGLPGRVAAHRAAGVRRRRRRARRARARARGRSRPADREAVHQHQAADDLHARQRRPGRERDPGRLVGRRAAEAAEPRRPRRTPDRRPGFTDRVRELIATGGGTETMDTVLGEALVAVQPLRDDTREGALVVAYLSGAEREEVLGAARIYAVVSLLALLAVTLGAWSVAGRLLRPVRELRVHRARHQRHRSVPPDPGRGRRRRLRPRTHRQRDARPARGLVRHPTDLPRRRRPRAADAGDRPARPPRAAGPVRPRGRVHDPAAAARRDRPDVPTGRRPDRAGQGRPAGLRSAGAAEVGALTDQVLDKARATADRTGSWTNEPRARCSSTRSGSPRRCSSWPPTRSGTRPTATSWQWGRGWTAGRCRCGSATPGRGSPRRIGTGSSSASCVATAPRPARAPGSASRSSRPLPRPMAGRSTWTRHRARARRSSCPCRSATPTSDRTLRMVRHEPRVDRRGRGPHRRVRREGPAGQRTHTDRGGRRAVRSRARDVRRVRPGGARRRAAGHGRVHRAATAAPSPQRDPGDRADRP